LALKEALARSNDSETAATVRISEATAALEESESRVCCSVLFVLFPFVEFAKHET
jgi:hypothetical protein